MSVMPLNRSHGHVRRGHCVLKIDSYLPLLVQRSLVGNFPSQHAFQNLSKKKIIPSTLKNAFQHFHLTVNGLNP